MASFDVKRVTPLEWAGIGAGALAFIVSFFPWYSVSFGGSELAGFGIDTSVSAWNAGFGAWFACLLLLGAGVVVALPHFGTQVPNLAMIWLGLSAAALVIIVLRWVTFPSTSGFGASAGAGFGLFVGLAVALVSGVAAFLSYRSSSARTTAA
ncbi:MAG: hypothetical protein LC721_09850 [Actinobacteria bacterium]|nr:hypothetical protein [Actinomycetota bacterium]